MTEFWKNAIASAFGALIVFLLGWFWGGIKELQSAASAFSGVPQQLENLSSRVLELEALAESGSGAVPDVLVLPGLNIFSNGQMLEAEKADKRFYDDADCSLGHMRSALLNTLGDGNTQIQQAAVCVCAFPNGKAHGWYCLD